MLRLFQGDEVAEDGGVHRRDLLVLVHGAKIPMLEFAGTVELLQIAVELVDLVGVAAHQHGAFDQRGRLVRDDVVDLAMIFVDLFGTRLHLLDAGHLLTEPGARIGAHIAVVAFTAAEDEDALILDLKHLAAVGVKAGARNAVHLSLVPDGGAVFGLQQIEILVGAVGKQNIIAAAAQLLQEIVLLGAAVPDKAEVAADNKSITCLKLFKTGVIKSRKDSVCVTGYIYHKKT